MKLLFAVSFVCHCLSPKMVYSRAQKVRLTFLLLLVCFRDRRVLQPAQVCDILKGVILVICYFMMHYVDYSMMYHLIRGQSVIKLYIIYNMLEVSPAGPAHGFPHRTPSRRLCQWRLQPLGLVPSWWPCENAHLI